MSRNDRPTLPPSSPDDETSAFESEVQEVGESSARWNQLIALLEEREALS
jgi:hypothetical protein